MRSLQLSLSLTVSCLTGCSPATRVAASEGATPKPAANTAVVQPGAGSTPQCGDKGLPDCPLQRWMKGTLQTYQRAADHERLASALKELAEHAPAGYRDWKAISEKGAQLAAAKDDTALKQICRDCHQTHRARYRKEQRMTPM